MVGFYFIRSILAMGYPTDFEARICAMGTLLAHLEDACMWYISAHLSMALGSKLHVQPFC